MWRSLWRSIDRFSVQYFKYLINELRQIKVVHEINQELVVDILQSIVEIVTYGDRHDPSIFECFMEYQVLAEFVRLLKINRNSRIEAPLLQYLSIMIQNMESEHAVYYCFSNDYINNIILHQYEFDKGDLLQYYISFLRAVSGKINRDTLCLLVKVQQDVVVSFPLYIEAIKFARHGEKMIQIAVRAITLNIYNVSDDMVYQFLTTSPNSDYFLELVQSLREQCLHLDALGNAKDETCTPERRQLLMETDKIVDDLYYLKDIISIGESRLSTLISQNLLSILVFPILLPLLQLSQSNGASLSAITSFYVVSRLLQVIDEKDMVNSVAAALVYPYMASSMKGASEVDRDDDVTQIYSYVNHLNADKEKVRSSTQPEGAESIYQNGDIRHLPDYMSRISCFVSCPSENVLGERKGIRSYVASDNHRLLLASLFLLILVAESKDLDLMLAAMLGSSQTKTVPQKIYENSTSQLVVKSIFEECMPQILSALLKVLSSQPPFSVLIQRHTGWFLRKLLVIQENKLTGHEFHLFNTSYELSRERLWKELDGCWFDHIPETLRNEWGGCKSALEESSQYKDPFFTLELDCSPEAYDGSMVSSLAWRIMVDAVKLKTIICNGDPVESPFINLRTSIIAISGRTDALDLSSASFGSEIALGNAVPCKIALSRVGLKDVYMLPVTRGISGKLLLLEKHPLRNQRGIVLADAPLAGLKPKIDENHPTWLHLRIREFDPKIVTNKIKVYHSSKFNHVTDGRWTLGFPSAEACEAGRLLIVEEINKQRSAVEDLLVPLQNNCLGNLSDIKR